MNSAPFRQTRQRRFTLDALRTAKSHPTADQLYALLRSRLPHISLATVYRNLEFLAAQKLIRKLDLPGSQMRFDGNATDHHHIRCGRCGRVDDLSGALPCCVEEAFQGATDFRITGHRVDITGICPDCQRQETPKAQP